MGAVIDAAIWFLLHVGRHAGAASGAARRRAIVAVSRIPWASA
jgi:hypothetical protein